MKTVDVDFTRELGPIKAVNGVGNGPLTGRFTRDRRPEFKRAGIPFSRLLEKTGGR